MEDNNMIKTTVKVDGMMCGMCESHVNDAVRKVFQVDKVTSSHSKGETVIISDGQNLMKKRKVCFHFFINNEHVQ